MLYVQSDYQKMIIALTGEYYNVFIIEPEKDVYSILKQDKIITTTNLEDLPSYSYAEQMEKYANNSVLEKDRNVFLNTLLPSALIDKFSGNIDGFKLYYSASVNGNSQDYLAHCVRISKETEPLKVLAGYRRLDSIEEDEKEFKECNQDEIFNVLTRNFQFVYWMNLNEGTIRVLKMNNNTTLNVNAHTSFAYEKILNFAIAEHVHPEDQTMLKELLDLDNLRVVFKQNDEYTGNFRAIQDEETHYYQFNLYKLNEKGNVILGFQNIDSIIEMREKEERIQKEKEQVYQQQLEEQLAVFDVLARNFKNVYLVNLNNNKAKILKMEDTNQTYHLENMGDSSFFYEKFLKEWIHEEVHPDDQDLFLKELSPSNLKKVFSTQDEYIGNYRVIVDGKILNYQFNLSKLNEDGYLIAGFQNIDSIIEEHLEQERIQKEKDQQFRRELLAAKQEADMANMAKTEFLQRMSHDVRTPLNGIRGMLDIAEHYKDDLDKQAECRQKVREASDLLLELINEVLDMSKLESGQIILEHVPFDMLEVSIDVYTMVERQASEKDVQIIQDDCHTPHRKLLGSPLHFKRILMNIVSNAIKYNKDHGKIYITCKELECKDGKCLIQFKCRDTGIGMSEEFKRHVFEAFTQENAATRTNYKGTGLGMPIVKSLVEIMGGTITFESEKNVGTTFDVQIPFEMDTDIHENVVEENIDESIKGLNILLAEDNELNMEIAKFMLEQQGAHITCVYDGQEAIDVFKKSKENEYDLILMDVMMPKIDGHQATRIIRQMDRKDANIPIIAMTANAFVEDRLKAKEAGMNEHISKPLDTKLLIKTISKLVKEV